MKAIAKGQPIEWGGKTIDIELIDLQDAVALISKAQAHQLLAPRQEWVSLEVVMAAAGLLGAKLREVRVTRLDRPAGSATETMWLVFAPGCKNAAIAAPVFPEPGEDVLA